MTTRNEIEAGVREIFEKTLKIDPGKLHRDADLRDAGLQLDSLDMIEAVYEIEERFDVQIPEDKIQGIRTFGDIIDQLAASLNVH